MEVNALERPVLPFAHAALVTPDQRVVLVLVVMLRLVHHVFQLPPRLQLRQQLCLQHPPRRIRLGVALPTAVRQPSIRLVGSS